MRNFHYVLYFDSKNKFDRRPFTADYHVTDYGTIVPCLFTSHSCVYTQAWTIIYMKERTDKFKTS